MQQASENQKACSSTKTKSELKSPAKDKNTYYSKELSDYYQKHHLGLPRYQCFQLLENQFQAQITLPDGNTIFGKPEKSAKDAYENLARSVLIDLAAQKVKSPETPPKVWSINHMVKCAETQSKKETQHSLMVIIIIKVLRYETF